MKKIKLLQKKQDLVCECKAHIKHTYYLSDLSFLTLFLESLFLISFKHRTSWMQQFEIQGTSLELFYMTTIFQSICLFLPLFSYLSFLYISPAIFSPQTQTQKDLNASVCEFDASMKNFVHFKSVIKYECFPSLLSCSLKTLNDPNSSIYLFI